ncbi:MAG: flagellar biosynthesis protein FlhB [Peptococcaceae bacterium]|nr:flagellar biosynthesis protein FlhB [Peptococcaceae bacterium]
MKALPEKKKAVALAYDNIGAPKVVAKGRGHIAQKIIQLAQKEGIPLQKNSDLVEALLQVELSQEIPEELYLVVAEILAFVYKLDKANKIAD